MDTIPLSDIYKEEEVVAEVAVIEVETAEVEAVLVAVKTTGEKAEVEAIMEIFSKEVEGLATERESDKEKTSEDIDYPFSSRQPGNEEADTIAASEALNRPLTKETPSETPVHTHSFSFLSTPTLIQTNLFLNMPNPSGEMGQTESVLRTLGKRWLLKKEPFLVDESEKLKEI